MFELIHKDINGLKNDIASLRAHLDDRQTHQNERLDKIMATLDETLALVTAEGTKDDSIIVLMNGIKDQLATALGGALSPDAQAKVDAIFAQATANSSKIQAAIDANTPVAPAAV